MIGKYRFSIIFLVLLLFFWQGIVRMMLLPQWLLPAPSDILQAIVGMYPLLMVHTGYTLLEAVIGFGLAVIVALALSVLMDLSPLLRQAIYPLIVVSQTIPIVSVAPLFLIWFGYGLLPKVLVVTLVCFFPIVISVTQGMEAADEEMVHLLKVMGANTWQIIREVRLPAAMPSFFAGLKIAATYSIMGAVIGEWLGASKGLGVFMTRATHSYQLNEVFAAIFIITILSLSLFLLIEIISRALMPWQTKERKE